jgi:hypothetical protein
MRKLIIACAWIFLFKESIAQVTFNKVFDIDNGIESAGSVVVTNDNNFLFYGSGRYNFVNGRNAISIFKSDQQGNILWYKQYGKITQSWFGNVGVLINRFEGGYALCGTVYDSLADQTNALVMKFDENGDTLFTKQYGGSRNDNFSSIRQMEDGSFYLLGSTLSYGDINGDYYLVKTDSVGNELWYKTYGSNSYERGASIDITLDNGLILGGSSAKFTPKPNAPLIIKTDSLGSIQWEKTYGTQNGADCGGQVFSLKDGGYIITHCIDTFSQPSDKVMQLIKTDESGEILWRRVFDNSVIRIIRRAKELQDGTLLFAGEIWNTQEGRYTGYLIKYDANGNLLWERKPSYIHPGRPSQGSCAFYDFVEDANNYLVLTGVAFGASNNSDFWLLKLDEYGCEVAGCQVGINDPQTPKGGLGGVYPNPVSDRSLVIIKVSQQYAQQPCIFMLFDVNGREVYRKSSTFNTSGYYEFLFEKNNLNKGIYFYTVQSNNEPVGKGKIMIQ